jgi:hypothetical protein
MEEITTLKRQVANLTTDNALLCIIQKGGGGKSFLWAGQLWTASQARKEWESCLLEMACSKLGVIRFFGGPPKAATWYDGTVLSMLCDLILFDEKTKALSLEEKLSV